MLALTTHVHNFWILREDDQNSNLPRFCQICASSDHDSLQCKIKQPLQTQFNLAPFRFLHIAVLREYIEAEMKVNDISFTWDAERAIDDWIFLCFFVGNDFLPHIPSLDIKEGAI
jgi:5'-3' exoribonuclease 2